MGLNISIWDVEHGNCATLYGPGDELIMIDAGHNDTTDWRPSEWLRRWHPRLDIFIASNLDEDHLTDLPNVHRVAPPVNFKTNSWLEPDWVKREKERAAGIGPGVAQALAYMRAYNGPPGLRRGTLDLTFYGLQPTFTNDLNNLSLVTFAAVPGFCICFPGDLQWEGWELFLKNPDFRANLAGTTIFVASHHGRRDGYHSSIFNYCHPDLVIFSDKAIQHGTQEGMATLYGQHARGIKHQQTGQVRSVLTTRNDGDIHIEVADNGTYNIRI